MWLGYNMGQILIITWKSDDNECMRKIIKLATAHNYTIVEKISQSNNPELGTDVYISSNNYIKIKTGLSMCGRLDVFIDECEHKLREAQSVRFLVDNHNISTEKSVYVWV